MLRGTEDNAVAIDKRERLRTIIFESDTPAGKAFDVALITAIAASVIVVMLDSIQSMKDRFGELFYVLEWCLTIAFTIEYALRLYCVGKPLRYATSFLGIIDLLAILPTYLSLVYPGAHFATVIRVLRVLRVFRVLKLSQYVRESNIIARALYQSRRKILVFLTSIITLVIVLGSVMYLIEDPEAGFTSIPQSIYWAIVTLTTVGYGDISPVTPLGKAVASFVMILGYCIIAVPTGIVTSELAQAMRQPANVSTRCCPSCGREGHDEDADYCKFCGEELREVSTDASNA